MIPATAGLGRSRPFGWMAAAVYLSVLALVTHLSGFGPFGVALFPVALIITGFTPITFLWVSLAGFLLFFEAHLPGSNAGPFNSPDLAAAAFLLHSIMARNGFTYRLPVSPLLLCLYVFLAYAAALSVGPAFTFGPLDNWLLRDLKCLLYLGLAAMLVRDPMLGPKHLVLLLLGMVTLTSAHSALCVLEFLLRGGRIGTWNEIYLADALLLATVLFTLPQLQKWRRVLGFCLVLCFLGLLVTETRGVWMGAALSLLLYATIQVAGSNRTRLVRIGKVLATIVLLFVAASFLLRLTINYDITARVRDRFAQGGSVSELINPYSSLGYRLHESYAVWEQRSWFGHGTGARLHLFFTQMGKSEMMDWWAIHSEYFEILHKYGFVGLALFLLLLGMMAWRALRLALMKKSVHSAMGFSVLLSLANHAVASITSGYIIREHVAIYLVVLIVILERFYPAVLRSREAAARRLGTAV